MASQWIVGLAALLLLVFPATVSSQSKPEAFFVLGDSYADIGNIQANNPTFGVLRQPPYGVTWPGRPTGRASDGYISTDYLADFFRIQTPLAYSRLRPTTEVKYYKRGVDFAVAGAGIYTSFGSPTYSDQVLQLKAFLAQHPDIFTAPVLRHSIVYITYTGNDYAYQYASNNNSLATITPEFAAGVVGGIDRTVRDLYVAGFRNFLVTYAPPLGCSPAFTANGTAPCNDALNGLVTLHNDLLRAALYKVTWLPASNVAVADLYKTFSYVAANAQWFGFPSPGANVVTVSQDPQGNVVAVANGNPAEFFWWDAGHPTQAGWNAVANLVNSGFNFTDFTYNLVYWFNLLNLTDVSPRNEARITGDVQAAVAAVTQTGQYTLLLDIVNRSNALLYVPGVLSKTFRVTLFLPTDAAVVRQLGSTPLAKFLQTNPQVGLSALSLHAVYGWWPAARLLGLPTGSSLQTVAGTSLTFYNEPAGLFVGAPQAQGGVQVVQPDLYSASYTGAVHGIDGVLVPSFIRPLPGAV